MGTDCLKLELGRFFSVMTGETPLPKTTLTPTATPTTPPGNPESDYRSLGAIASAAAIASTIASDRPPRPFPRRIMFSMKNSPAL